MSDHLSFTIERRNIVDGILIPKYYDPDLTIAGQAAGADVDLPTLESLLLPGSLGSQLGVWVPREYYGTGTIPYIRTSDIAHWRVRTDFKQGVSEEVHARFAKRVDLKPQDLLFVAHGTYLVGEVAIVLDDELPALLQDHVFRLTVDSNAVHPYLLLAALSTKFVKRQVRARQFSAEIIDKIGERHLSIRVPIPRDPDVRKAVIDAVDENLQIQSDLRRRSKQLFSSQPGMSSPRASTHLGFSVRKCDISNNILIPRYYDPEITEQIENNSEVDEWASIQELVDMGLLSVSTGVEPGKLAYGTGSIPFIRTSDLVELEILRDTKHGVSEEIYKEYSKKGAVRSGDVLVVRDGTYLVGASALVVDDDVPALICGGLYRLRSNDEVLLPPARLLGLLNLPIVKRQIRARQFSRDVIDTLGQRFLEVKLPDPKSELAVQLGNETASIVKKKSGVKRGIVGAIHLVEPRIPANAHTRPSWSMR